jgi:hypothetical protein
MKKFVTVFIGSRGCLEEVNLVENELSLFEYSQSIVDGIYADIDVADEDYEDQIEYLSEFVTINECKGFNEVGLNEEEYLFIFDFEENEDLCEKLLELFENEDEEGIMDIIDKLDY